jgi:hypothetical protein
VHRPAAVGRRQRSRPGRRTREQRRDAGDAIAFLGAQLGGIGDARGLAAIAAAAHSAGTSSMQRTVSSPRSVIAPKALPSTRTVPHGSPRDAPSVPQAMRAPAARRISR